MRVLAAVKAGGPATPADRRAGERKVCRVSAQLSVGDGAPIAARTLDLSSSGMALLLPTALPRGTVGEVSFALFIGETLRRVKARIEVSNCVFLSAHVRVGCRFLSLDAASLQALATFVR